MIGKIESWQFRSAEFFLTFILDVRLVFWELSWFFNQLISYDLTLSQQTAYWP